MDSIQQKEATSHSGEPSSSTPPTSLETKALRSSARVKAAKEKERERAEQPPSSSSSSSKRIRETAAKGKGKEVSDDTPRISKRARRSTFPTAPPLTINEPPKDAKGKKRAAPDENSEEEAVTSVSAPVKRTRPSTSSYSLRSRTDAAATPTDMPKKTRSTSGKGKAASRSKAMAASIPSGSRAEDEDIEMLDAEYMHDDLHDGGDAHGDDKDEDDVIDDGGGNGGESDHDDEDEDAEEARADRGLGGLDDSAPLSMFGDYRHLGSYMLGLNSRLKTMLNNIKRTADPTTRLLTLQELSELLSISTEDTLAGSFPVEQYVRELVRILGGTGNEQDGDEEEEHEQDEDAALAAAIALSTGGGAFQGDENLEAQVLACRCLANLMEALPGVAHTVVYHGAIPVLCSKLIEISYIDLAEQTLSTLEKISEEFPSSIVREGGLAALLNYLDFFSIAVQRTALQAASNCCRNVSPEHFPMIRGVWPIIRNCLGYTDQRLVEYACLCVIRVVDAYYRTAPEHLEALVDQDLIQAVNNLLMPSGGSPLIAANTFTQLLRALATSARASPKITVVLLEAGIVDTLYQILTGVLPPASSGTEEQGEAGAGQGLGGGLADMTVMENLAHRPKDQIEEALSLVSELMPPLPKDGVFDHKAYTEKALSRLHKAKAKAERAAARLAAANAANLLVGLPLVTSSASTASIPTEDSPAPESVADNHSQADPDTPSAAPAKEQSINRTDLLRSKPEVVNRFMQLMVPILVDVYAASVIAPVRVKSLTGLLKAVSFLDADDLKQVFTFVPVASFASSILSSKDSPSLVIGALQLVELLLVKVPAEYKPAFRREGVFHEIEALASRSLSSAKSKEKDKDKDKEPSEVASPADAGTPTYVPAVASLAFVPGYKKLSSLAIDPDDAITVRARVIKFKYLSGDDADAGDDLSAQLGRLVNQLAVKDAGEKELMPVLVELASLFASPHTSVSSFELLQSGVVDGSLSFISDSDRTLTVEKRRELFFEAFTSRKVKGANGQTPLAIFVKKLQESLTRMESFEVVTVAQSADESKRSSPSLLARQIRLRLVGAEDSDVPKSFNNVIVSIHAIATFQALHDYLRPRVAGLMAGGSRLSSMLAALQASGFAGASAAGALAGEASRSAATDSASSAGGITRRRSQRLSAKKAKDTEPSDGQGSEIAQPPSTLESPEAAPSDTVVEDDFGADFTDDEVDVDAEVIDEDEDQEIPEKTVNVSVGDDGSKVIAQTPDGTRVATPNPARSANVPRSSATPKTSYAAAVKTKPNDWHLEFSMDEQKLPLDLTVYGAIHQQEARKKSGLPSSMIWQGIYTVKYKKVPGPAPSPESRGDDVSSRSRSPVPSLSSLPEDAPHAKILRLLRVLYRLNSSEAERTSSHAPTRTLPESAFINNKLTAKLTRQLEEPMIVASSCLPDWALDLPQHFPFLFPFATRYNFLQSTSFGYARLILKWQSQQQRGQDSSSRRDDGVGFLGRLQRQKVRISRKHILESAVKVFELYGSSSSILEVEYFEEVGTGLGPTLEFYSLVSKEFARRDLKIWRDADDTKPGAYVHHPTGLFPAPIPPEDIVSDGGVKRTHIYRVIGQFVAKAMLDSRIIDLSLNKVFLKLILGEEVPLTIENLKRVDPELAASMIKLRAMTVPTGQSDKMRRKLGMVTVEDLALDFTVPGYDVELRPGGRNLAVTSENVEEYIADVLEAIIGKGAMLQAKAFREGFSKVFPIADLQAFTADELVMLFGNSDEDWSIETLSEAIKADHGFNVESRAIHDLLDILSEFDMPMRRSYLQFITGSPKLPIGGFRGLNPPLTVVRKPHEPPLTADDYLPSVMTCVNYLKLPEYSTKAVMKEKLVIAMREGVGSFHLS
ncbi:Ubiquitin fusion degradation protein [Phanerochaete sordida]|uniref:HECT-type E3 ubiquitin transferase n=1 Tax=Phanerochaete sordida TaxID=48140 RepID=A0A9P3GRA2_9APHY|nr:Ubiquitin fusion degradation protein [Phanerochaete sordida]